MIKPKIYFAGRISEWRDQLMPQCDHKHEIQEPEELHRWLDEAVAEVYNGPYFIKEQHAYIGDVRGFHKHEAHPRNLEAIDACDAVIAYIDSDKAFGTLYEIGYAVAKRKTIYVLMPTDLGIPIYKDLWFVLHGLEEEFINRHEILPAVKRIITQETQWVQSNALLNGK